MPSAKISATKAAPYQPYGTTSQGKKKRARRHVACEPARLIPPLFPVKLTSFDSAVAAKSSGEFAFLPPSCLANNHAHSSDRNSLCANCRLHSLTCIYIDASPAYVLLSPSISTNLSISQRPFPRRGAHDSAHGDRTPSQPRQLAPPLRERRDGRLPPSPHPRPLQPFLDRIDSCSPSPNALLDST